MSQRGNTATALRRRMLENLRSKRITCPASSSGSASFASSASASPTRENLLHKLLGSLLVGGIVPNFNPAPRHRWASTGHDAEPRRLRRAPSPSHGSGHAGSTCPLRSGTHDGPAKIVIPKTVEEVLPIRLRSHQIQTKTHRGRASHSSGASHPAWSARAVRRSR